MTRGKPLAAALVVAGVVLAPASSAFAGTQAKVTCDAYSHKCTEVKGTKIVKPPAVEGNDATLPFTGAEIVGMTLAGGAAIGGGAVLIVAGRRRRRAATPA